MSTNSNWSRRKFSKAVISAQLLLASGSLSLASSCISKESKPTSSFSDLRSKQVLTKVMDLLIPESPTHMSASQAGGLEYIVTTVKELPDIEQVFIEILEQLDTSSHNSHQKSFIKTQELDQIKTLKKFESQKNELFTVLKNFVYESYYINEDVWKQIGYVSYPTGSMGPKMKPFDPSLLNRVKSSTITFKKI